MSDDIINNERTRLFEAVQTSFGPAPPNDKAYFIPSELIPESIEEWLARARDKPLKVWQFIMDLANRFIIAAIPRRKTDLLMHVHQLTLMAELMSAIPAQIPNQIINTIPTLGRKIWEYYTRGDIYSHPEFRKPVSTNLYSPRIVWWQLLLRLRYAVVHKAEPHAIFLRWYQSSISDILAETTTLAAKRYLLWAHEDGFLACTQHDAMADILATDDFVQAECVASEQQNTNFDSRATLTFIPRKTASTLLPANWQASRICDLKLSVFWRILLILHAEWHTLQWTANVDLLLLLLWHHLQGFILGELPETTQWYDSTKFTVARNSYQVNYSFISRTEVLFVTQLEVIRTRWHCLSQVINKVHYRRFLNIGLIECPNAFQPTRAEIDNILQTMHEVYASGHRIVQGIDSRVALNTHESAFYKAALIPGERTDLQERMPAVILKPALVVENLRPRHASPIATLTFASDSYSLIEQYLTGILPDFKMDLSPFMELAFCILLRSLLMAAESKYAVGEGAASSQAIRTQMIDEVANLIRRPDMSLNLLDKNVQNLYVHGQQVLETATEAVSSKNVVECRPRVTQWWIVTEDKEHELPFVYPRGAKWFGRGPSLPRLIYIRGVFWLIDDTDTCFIETTDCLTALRAFVCVSAFKFPQIYKKLLDPLLYSWFATSADNYAQIALQHNHTNNVQIRTR